MRKTGVVMGGGGGWVMKGSLCQSGHNACVMSGGGGGGGGVGTGAEKIDSRV